MLPLLSKDEDMIDFNYEKPHQQSDCIKGYYFNTILRKCNKCNKGE